ncbi:MAG: endolytic transglycosylase MltG [Candidatus Rokuibacteriota bacterium]
MRLRRIVLLVAVALGVTTAALAWLALTPGRALRDRAGVVEVPAHAGVFDIGRRLEKAGVVRSRFAFVAAAVVHGSPRRLRAGEYEVPRGATTPEVVALLESGRVRQHAVLLPEGGTVAELARALEAERLAGADEVLRVASDRQFLASLDIDAASVEGYLFPDTYHFVRGQTAPEMLGKMVQRLRQKVTGEIIGRARARGLTLHELLTLASIIEREARAPEERRLIAAVFWNRLRLEMPLQADPTVQYAVGKERLAPTRADLVAEHPYNTYRHAGLPPGPIASPGMASIEAALDPAPVGYLYFVARNERHHYFSRTVEEHNAAVVRYRRSRR